MALRHILLLFVISTATMEPEHHMGKAFSWWKKGAKMKDNALCLFMQCFINRGNRKKAKRLFDQSFSKIEEMASQDSPYAQNFLGVYNSTGFMGNPVDFIKAAELYEKSAMQGFVEAQCNIGCFYFEGKGVQLNIQKAIEWFDKAIVNGCKNSIPERQKAVNALRTSGTNGSSDNMP